MTDKRFRTLGHSLVAPILWLVTLSGGCVAAEEPGVIKVAVLLDDTFPDGGRSLEWAVDIVNSLGGVAGGQMLELEYHLSAIAGEQAEMDSLFESEADAVFADPDVALVVVGNAERLFAAGSKAINNEKVVISPSATAAEIFRAFAGKRYVWRLTKSDTAQAAMFLQIAREHAANSVALLSGFNMYSNSFFSWFGFYATENGYLDGAVAVDRYEQDPMGSNCDEPMERMLDAQPDLLFVVPESPAQLRCMLRVYVRYGLGHINQTQLFFADKGYNLAVLSDFGTSIDGVSGFALGSPPASGFDAAYRRHFDVLTVPANVANAYDAMMLVAYGLEISGGKFGSALADAMSRVVGFRGPTVGWDQDGIAAGLGAIRERLWPDVTGATGDLEFVPEVFTELNEMTYAYWRVEAGEVVTPRHYRFSPNLSTAGEDSLADNSGAYEPPMPRGELKVVIGSFSLGWSNYRHQADAMAMYQVLRQRGVDDEQIIMFGADDLAFNEANRLPGEVRHGTGGTNVNVDVSYDYGLEELGAAGILRMLAADRDGLAQVMGRASGAGLTVLESDETTNLLLFLVGHGADRGLAVGAHDPEDAYGGSLDYLTPKALRLALCGMQANRRYRRVLVMIDACHSGVYGFELEKGCDDPDARTFSLLQRTLEPGDGCGAGGIMVEATPSGAASSQDVLRFSLCHDLATGARALADVHELDVGDELCSGGGATVSLGHDLDGNGWLSESEITQRHEVCHGLAHRPLNGVLLITAANPSENSLGFGFDPELEVWTADQVAFRFIEQGKTIRGASLRNVYRDITEVVSGSHPMIYNAEAFGDISSVSLDEFMLP